MFARFCCEGSCVRIDTLIPDVKLQYISIVSPNPFKPGSEMLEFVYKVPLETNVTIRIYDESNRLVAEPVVNQTSPRHRLLRQVVRDYMGRLLCGKRHVLSFA